MVRPGKEEDKEVPDSGYHTDQEKDVLKRTAILIQVSQLAMSWHQLAISWPGPFFFFFFFFENMRGNGSSTPILFNKISSWFMI